MNFNDKLRLSIKENAITGTFDELSITPFNISPTNENAHELYTDALTNLPEILQDALTTILPYSHVSEPTATGKEHDADCIVNQIITILKGSINSLPTPPNYAVLYNLLGEALQIIQDLQAV
jgi:hypothetical protein